MDFKSILKNRRSELGLTLDEIGHHVGVSGATVSRWENGEIENIRRDKIAKLAEILDVTPSYLMGWPEKSPTQTDKNNVAQTEDEEDMLLLARHMEPIPEEDRRQLKEQFKKSIDLYLKARGLSETEDK